MNTQVNAAQENPSIKELRAHQERMREKGAELDMLNQRRRELESVAYLPMPNIEAIRAELVDASLCGDANEKDIESLQAKLREAKAESERISKANQELTELRHTIEQRQTIINGMAQSLIPLQHEAIKAEAIRAAGNVEAKLAELVGAWLECRSIAEQAEQFGTALIPANYRHGFQFEWPAPIIGVTPVARYVENMPANDARVIESRTRAKETVRAILGE